MLLDEAPADLLGEVGKGERRERAPRDRDALGGRRDRAREEQADVLLVAALDERMGDRGPPERELREAPDDVR